MGYDTTMKLLLAIRILASCPSHWELVTHPHVVLSQMSSADAAGVEELLTASRTFDIMAGWTVASASRFSLSCSSRDHSRTRLAVMASPSSTQVAARPAGCGASS